MAQNITLMGASYSAVPAVTLPKTGGGTASFTDVSDTTATAADVASGTYFYTAAGVRTEGTASGGGGVQTAYVEGVYASSVLYYTDQNMTVQTGDEVDGQYLPIGTLIIVYNEGPAPWSQVVGVTQLVSYGDMRGQTIVYAVTG